MATAFGLSASAGLNAYIPLLAVAFTAKYTSLIKLNQPWDAMTSWWVIGLLIFLLVVELIVDKIPAIDTINDIIHTFVRPVAGAILFASSSGVVGEVQPVLAFIAGLLLAGGVHAAKATIRPAVTATTAGTGNWLVSSAENVSAVTTSVLSIIIPIVVIVVAVILIILIVLYLRRRRSRRRAAKK